MSFYPAKINERFLSPSRAGAVARADATGKAASFVCGAAMQISLKIDNNKIVAAKFKAAGCGYLIAAADVLCEKIENKSVAEIGDIIDLIENELGEFNERRGHCLELCVAAFKNTIDEFRCRKSSEWNGDDALVCACFGVSENTIREQIAAKFLATVEQVTENTRAGGGCGSCQMLIAEMIDEFWQEN